MPTARQDPPVLPRRPHPRQVLSQLLPHPRQVPSQLLPRRRRVLVLPASMIPPTGMMNTRMDVLGTPTAATALITVAVFRIKTLVPRPTRLAVSAEEEPRRPRLLPRQVPSQLLPLPLPGLVLPASTTQLAGMMNTRMDVLGTRTAIIVLITEIGFLIQTLVPSPTRLAVSAEVEPRLHRLLPRRVLVQLLPRLRPLLPIHATPAPVRMEVSAVAQDRATPALVSPASPGPIVKPTSTSALPTPARTAAAAPTVSMASLVSALMGTQEIAARPTSMIVLPILV